MHSSPSSTPPVALCLGGMDPSGGAGLIRDAITLAGLGIHPMVVSTADTMQNGEACHRIVSPSLDSEELVGCLAPHLAGAWGLKLGLCGLDPAKLGGMLRSLEAQAPLARIWDPVLAPTSGVGLHTTGSLRDLATVVLANPGWVVTPNRPEAAAFGALPESSDPQTLAEPWFRAGAAAVWLKGGHGQGDLLEDFWVEGDRILSLGRFPRLSGERRGTGCTVASAWLGLRLRGVDPVMAARESIEWLRDGWASAFSPGGFGRPLFAPGRS